MQWRGGWRRADGGAANPLRSRPKPIRIIVLAAFVETSEVQLPDDQGQ